MEMFILGLAVGGLVGAGGKRVMKPLAKGYMAVTDRAKEWGANLREDLRDTIEEARYEREREAALDEEAEAAEETAEVTRAPRRRRTRAVG
jgi:hypothetical protein